MSYQVLARKWRPAGFDEVTGQAHVTAPLRNAVRTGRVPHALLLTGPRGVGKTTLARILARCLNCEKGPTDEPCGSCTACTEIAAGSSTDVQEIDAASRTGVDDVREIIESVRYAPSPGKHRIYVVDEVHMLSTAAFNALLKTLEEPPPRSLFVFATTNPEKIPFTVVSRCQRYDLRRISTADVAARLGEVARSEGVEISEASRLAIARASEGSLRDGLTLLDQVLAAGGERVEDERVAEVLDLVDRRLLLGIAEACVGGDAEAALLACRRADESGVDGRRLGGELIQLWRDLVVLRVAPKSPELVEAADADLDAMRETVSRATAPRLRRMFRALVRDLEDLAWAPEPFAVLEMALVRLATLPEDEDVAALLARLEALERRLSGGAPGGSSGGGGAASGGGASRKRGGATRARADEVASEPRRAGPAASVPASEPPEATATPDAPEAGEPLAPAPATPPPGTGAARPAQVYDRLCAFAQQQNRGLFAALEGGRLVEHAPGRLRVALEPGIAARRLQGRGADLEAVCERFFGEPTRVEFEVRGGGGGETAPRVPARDDEGVRRRRKEALDHPAVNAALEILEGEILEIRPLGEPR